MSKSCWASKTPHKQEQHIGPLLVGGGRIRLPRNFPKGGKKHVNLLGKTTTKRSNEHLDESGGNDGTERGYRMTRFAMFGMLMYAFNLRIQEVFVGALWVLEARD